MTDMHAYSDGSAVVDIDSVDAVEDVHREHDAAVAANARAISHMINAGHILWKIREDIPRGGWTDWCAENLRFSKASAQLYMRFARFADLLHEYQPGDVRAARRLLAMHHPERVTAVNDPKVVAEAQRLRDEGWTGTRIAAHLGVTTSVVYRWINPEAYRKQIERTSRYTKLGRRVATERQREAVVKRKGGQTSIAYGHVRKALDALQHALEAEAETSARRAIQDAMNRLYAAEDEIVRASKEHAPREPRPHTHNESANRSGRKEG